MFNSLVLNNSINKYKEVKSTRTVSSNTINSLGLAYICTPRSIIYDIIMCPVSRLQAVYIVLRQYCIILVVAIYYKLVQMHQ